VSATLRIIASGLTSHQRNIDVIANNIANMQTPGFKKTRVEFKDLPHRPEALVAAEAGRITLADESDGEGVRINATQTVFTQGPLQEVGNPLDLALEGPGFFQLRLPDGSIAYTRNGSLSVDAQNRIVNHEGFAIEPPVTLPEGTTAVRVDADGSVWAQAGDGEPKKVGEIRVAQFANPEGLTAIGHGLFASTEVSGAPTVGAPGAPGQAKLHAGVLEQSNVDLADEASRLLQAQRAYQLNLQALRAWDQIAERATSLRG